MQTIVLQKKQGCAFAPDEAASFLRQLGEFHYQVGKGNVDYPSAKKLLQALIDGQGIAEQEVVATSESAFEASFTPLHNLTLCEHPAVPRTSLFRNTSIVPASWRDRDLGDEGHLGYFAEATCPASPTRPGQLLSTKKQMTCMQMLTAVAGDGSVAEMSRRLVERGLDITEVQWSTLVEQGNTGNTLLNTGVWNFAFTQTGRMLPDGLEGEYPELAVLRANRLDDRYWLVDVHRLDRSDDWNAGRGLVLGNRTLSA